MNEQKHFYIISYDIDGKSESIKSKQLLGFLKQYSAVCLTKSTWLLCTTSDCFTVFSHVRRILEESDPFYDDTFSPIVNGYAIKDRLFVAEVRGQVFGEWLICDELESNLTLDQLIRVSRSDLIEDGFKSIYGNVE